MFKQFDRYILKDILPPFFLGLLVYTFVFLMNQILLLSELLIDKGVALKDVTALLVYLIPGILAFTMPMSVLMGILAGLSRMSSDSEITAFKILGIGNLRLLRPIMLFSLCGLVLTSALTLFIAPRANYKWTQTLYSSVLEKVQFSVHPREFDESLPSTVMFIQEISADKTWENMFVYFSKEDKDASVVLAKKGNLNFFPEEKRATLELNDAVSHSFPFNEPEKYTLTTLGWMEEELDVQSIYVDYSGKKRVREKDIKELYVDIEGIRTEIRNIPANKQDPQVLHLHQRRLTAHWIEVHKKFALPFACIIFALLGITLGATTKKGGRTSGFTISIMIIIIYYILITAGENLAMDGKMAPWLGMWGPNILLSLLGLLVFIQSHREFSLIPRFSRFGRRINLIFPKRKRKKPDRTWPRLSLRFPNILDRYVLRKFLAIFLLVFFSMLAVIIIITFFEQIDSIYQNNKPLSLLFTFIWYQIPEYIHYILPVTALCATLLSLGLFTKFNEITAMKACGISVYRIILPLIVVACVLSFVSFYLQENVLPYTNKKAEEISNEISGGPPRSYSHLDRRWVMSRSQDRIFYYRHFDQFASVFSQISIFDIDPEAWSITRRIYADKAFLDKNNLSLVDGWMREFTGSETMNFNVFEKLEMALIEDQSYFTREWNEPDQMGYAELKQYIQRIEVQGFETVRFEVDLSYKITFPLASLVMVLLGIPFAFSMGKRGALVGIGLSVIIAMIYWGAIGIFKSMGYAGYLDILLSAWGPNLIFGLVGLYLLFTVRT